MNWIDYYYSQYENKIDHTISRWPLFIMMLGAIICLSCSTIYHLFYVHSEFICNKLSTLDFAGISFLIAGSCYPPYYYYFYCENGNYNLIYFSVQINLSYFYFCFFLIMFHYFIQRQFSFT